MKHEAVELLSRYLKIDTTNPPGDEALGVAFFSDALKKEGIEYKIFETPSGRSSIRAAIGGTGEKGAVILLNHIDVVPAQADEWSFKPFGGEVRDGFIHGRGALDMKGLGIMELLAFLEVKHTGVTPCRDLIFLATADEEEGGKNGVEYLLKEYPDDFEAGLILNEGGFGINNMLPNRPLFMVSAAEKGVCWVKLTRNGPSGHGSVPHGDNALEKLVQALNRVMEKEIPIHVSAVVADYFTQLGDEWEFLKPYIEDGKAETLAQALSRSGMLAVPQISAMLKDTISLNRMSAGGKTNVIPSQAEAELDIRILPGTDPDKFLAELKQQLADESIKAEFTTKYTAGESPTDTEDFADIKNVLLEHYPDAIVVPSLLFGASDSRFFREKGITSYGLCPAIINLEDLNKIHGIDEKISQENMLKGTTVYIDIVKKLCGIS